MKTCRTCKIEKPFEDFYKRGKTKSGEIEYRPDCMQCYKHPVLTPEQRRAKYLRNLDWKQKNADKNARHKRRARWKGQGIDPDIAEAYYTAHDGKCEICDETSNGKALAVDHDHETGTIRGMLCSNCNLAIGLFKDSSGLMIMAIDYLNSHNH